MNNVMISEIYLKQQVYNGLFFSKIIFSALTVREETFVKETFANFSNLEYFHESLIPQNVTVEAVHNSLFPQKFILAKISFLFFL